MPRSLIIALLALGCTLPGLAHAADPPMCRNGNFPAQGTAFGLAKVVGAPRTYLRSDTAPCPGETAACLGRVYVVPGDTVLTGAANGAYVCAFFPGKGGGSAGYVRPDEIAAQPVPAAPPLAWAGEWRDGDDSITLRANGTRLVAKGDAFWPSANPSLKERPGGPNLGEMSGTAEPKDNHVVFAGKDADDCRVELTLLPPFLLAHDNQNCGGMNVSFTGVYRRK